MRYSVPQFIEREMRIFGGLTFKGFFVLVAFIIVFVIFWKMLASFKTFRYLTSIFLIATFSILAFGKVEGIPIWKVIPRAILYLFSPKVFTMKKRETGFLVEYREFKLEKSKKIPLERKIGKIERKKINLEIS